MLKIMVMNILAYVATVIDYDDDDVVIYGLVDYVDFHYNKHIEIAAFVWNLILTYGAPI